MEANDPEVMLLLRTTKNNVVLSVMDHFRHVRRAAILVNHFTDAHPTTVDWYDNYIIEAYVTQDPTHGVRKIKLLPGHRILVSVASNNMNSML